MEFQYDWSVVSGQVTFSLAYPCPLASIALLIFLASPYPLLPPVSTVAYVTNARCRGITGRRAILAKSNGWCCDNNWIQIAQSARLPAALQLYSAVSGRGHCAPVPLPSCQYSVLVNPADTSAGSKLAMIHSREVLKRCLPPYHWIFILKSPNKDRNNVTNLTKLFGLQLMSHD